MASAVAGVLILGAAAATASAPPDAPACDLAPPDSHWHADVRDLPVHERSDTYVASIGLDNYVHAAFGPEWRGAPNGIPYTTVPGDQERVEVEFRYASESDPGPYPIPPDPPIEGGADADGDRHVLVVDRDACVLYELFDAHPREDGSWQAGSGAVFDLDDHTLRPDGWTSADAAGLPILPGLVRYDEVASGVIDHAIRVTVSASQDAYVWPARHQAGTDDPDLPPMGLRLRLRADADLSGLGPQARVVAEAMQRYGVIVADNGNPWFLSGVPDERWEDDDLHTLHTLTGRDFEAVDASGLMLDPDSGRIAVPESERARIWGGPGTGRIETAAALSRHTFPDGATTAVLARADGFADALAAGPLAAALDGPVLLTPGDALAPATRDELARLAVDDVVLAGGPDAISADVAEDLAGRGYTVTRHGGTDRFATAGLLAGAAVEAWRADGHAATGSRVLLALGQHADPPSAWPDALAAAAAGGLLHEPVLLSRGASVPDATFDALANLEADDVTLVGGPIALATDVEDELQQAGYTIDRVAGPDRYATAVAMAGRVLAAGRGGAQVIATTGRAFPDALAAGPALASTGGHLVLTRPDAVPDVVADHLSSRAPLELWVAGGPGAVDDATVLRLLELSGDG